MLMNQSSQPRSSLFNLPALCRVSAIAIFAGACTYGAAAQQPAPQLIASVTDKPLALATVAGVDYSSSSSDVASPVDSAAGLNLSAAGLQPPPRRRYGRPRYNDSQHNPDGSAKWTFVAGVGMTAPVGNTYHYLNTDYGIQVGGGRNFNKNFGVIAQFDYDRFGFNGRTLYNQISLYNYCPTGASTSACSTNALTSLDGNSHIWSFSLNPIYNFLPENTWGAYVVGGVGFFHKVANFTTPTTGIDIYGYQETENANIDHYTSNAPGFSGGFGLTYKAGKFSSEHLFVEARYVLVLDSQRNGLTASNINTTAGQAYFNSGATDYYPANSNRTTYTAYKAGVRF
jgi:hypothetical protein